LKSKLIVRVESERIALGAAGGVGDTTDGKPSRQPFRALLNLTFFLKPLDVLDGKHLMHLHPH
jgi:hypothetical protein